MGQNTYHKRKSSDTIRTVTAEVTWGSVRRQWEWVGQSQPHLQYLLARGEPALHRRRGGGAKHAAACAFQENSTWSLECLEQSMEHYLALICRLEPGVGWSWGTESTGACRQDAHWSVMYHWSMWRSLPLVVWEPPQDYSSTARPDTSSIDTAWIGYGVWMSEVGYTVVASGPINSSEILVT